MSVFCQAVVYLLVALPAVAQSQAFATITIKPARSADPRNVRVQVLPNADLIASAVPVIMLLSYAYDVPVNPSPRLSTLPDWALREKYDIEAKAPANAIPPSLQHSEVRSRIQQMIRGLLADRFRLVMRVENKTMSAYALTVASGGPKLQKSAIAEKDCTFNTGPDACHNFVGGPSPEWKSHRYGRPRPLHWELDGFANREPHGAQRAVHRKHGRLGPHAAATSATERHPGREPLRRPPDNLHGPGQTRSRTEAARGHLAGIHRRAHRAPGRQLTITLYYAWLKQPRSFSATFPRGRADAITGRNVAVPQKLPRPNCSWITGYSECASKNDMDRGGGFAAVEIGEPAAATELRIGNT